MIQLRFLLCHRSHVTQISIVFLVSAIFQKVNVSRRQVDVHPMEIVSLVFVIRELVNVRHSVQPMMIAQLRWARAVVVVSSNFVAMIHVHQALTVVLVTFADQVDVLLALVEWIAAIYQILLIQDVVGQCLSNYVVDMWRRLRLFQLEMRYAKIIRFVRILARGRPVTRVVRRHRHRHRHHPPVYRGIVQRAVQIRT